MTDRDAENLNRSPPGINDPMGAEPTAQDDRQAMPVDHEQPPKLAFPVVAIGASAGGVEAMTEFISAMRPDCGMAFVFIQHLPPEHESLMADILARRTRMTVFQVEEGMDVKPDHVYVIRPGHVLTIKDGQFHLGRQLGKRGASRPVDDFFKSLAEEQRERAIAILMSGMGSNGSAGAQAIKAVGGLCIAQDPETAQYPSMPRHLIDQGYADYILRPGHMPGVLLDYAGHPYARASEQDRREHTKRNDNHLREILAVLRTRVRTDFNGYKKPTVMRRVQRRMGLTRLTDMGDYAKLLRQSPSEVRSLADDLLIHVTGFFRDPESWETLRKLVIAPLIARRETEGEIRAWVTACSSGEEAYTLAMILVEESERANKPIGIKVFATDMAERPLQHARHGTYPGGIESEMDPARLERFFDKDEGVYRIKPFLRECVVFAPQNVLQDPPFSRLDIISCRNLLIYLEPDVQQRLLHLLHFGLREGGTLFLGSSETIGAADELYELVDKRARIYRRIGPTQHGRIDFPMPQATRVGAAVAAEGAIASPQDLARAVERRVGTGRPSIALITQRTLLDQHVRAAVTIDRDNRVLYFHGNTRPFLEQPPGEPTRDLMILIRGGLRGSVRVALHRCAAEAQAVTVLDGWVEVAQGRAARVAVTASPVSSEDPAHPDYFVVSFDQLDEHRTMPGASGNGGGVASVAGEGDGNGDPGLAESETETELRRIRDELQTTIEELQTSNEELKASHEEVTSINEELQSSNEELETSKEEMQSLNEELTTVNAQLNAKMEELQNASNDLTALLASTTIAVLFLDPGFRIRRFTPATRELLDLIQSDVGRPISDMRRKFDDPHLIDDARTVLEKLVPVEREVSAENGRHYARRVLPYRTVDNRIDGVVVTFFDVTARKEAEENVAQAREYAESIVETTHEPLIVLRADLTVRSANQAFYRHFKVNTANTLGRKIYDLGNAQWDIPALRKALEEVLPTNKAFDDYEVEHTFEDLGRRVMLLNGRRLNHVQLILLGIRDVTGEREMTAALKASGERFKRMSSVPGLGILTLDIASGVLIDANDAFLAISGYTREQVTKRKLTWRDMTPPEYVPESERQMEMLRQTGRIGPYEKDYFRANGSRARLLFAGADMGDGTVVEYAIDLGVFHGDTARVRESEERFRLIVENVKDYGIFTADASGIITSWNPGAERIFGYSRDEIVGQDARILFTPEDQATRQHEQELELARQEGRASDDRWQRRKNGEAFWAAGVTSAMRDEAGNVVGFIKIVRDETRRKQLEEQLRQTNESLERRVAERTGAMQGHQRQLRSLLAELGRSEIRQRRILATELHDNLAQLLAVCKMRVASIEAAAPVDSKVRADASVVKDSLGDAITYTRNLMTDLRPDVLDEHDLPAAVEWVAKRMAPHGLKVEVVDDGKPKPMHEEMLGFVFQAVRELLWNVVKHARTTEAVVSIERVDQSVKVTVEDNGVGFNPSKRATLPTEAGGFGLFSIAERIDLLGGRMDIQSARRRGTRVSLSVPVDPCE